MVQIINDWKRLFQTDLLFLTLTMFQCWYSMVQSCLFSSCYSPHFIFTLCLLYILGHNDTRFYSGFHSYSLALYAHSSVTSISACWYCLELKSDSKWQFYFVIWIISWKEKDLICAGLIDWMIWKLHYSKRVKISLRSVSWILMFYTIFKCNTPLKCSITVLYSFTNYNWPELITSTFLHYHIAFLSFFSCNPSPMFIFSSNQSFIYPNIM